MPKFPIPDDWNGQDWRCVQVEWPDSPQYRAILLGFMTYLSRGRAWHEATGTVTEAQAVGWEIFDRNYPFTPCDGGEPCEVCTTGAFAGAGGGCDEDDECEECSDMACITAIKIEDGKLYVQYGCCDWIEVGPIDASVVENLPNLPWEQPGQTPPGEYSSCGKAHAVVAAMLTVGNAAWGHRASAPVLFQRKLESDSGLKLKWLACLMLQEQALLVDYVWEAQLFQPDVMDEWICTLDRWFVDDGNGMNSATVDAFLHHVMLSNWGNLIDDAFAANFWGIVMQAIGTVNFDNIAKIGAIDIRDDCDCPEAAASRPSSEDIIYDILAELTPATDSDGNLTLNATNTLVSLVNTANGEQNKLVRVDDIDTDMSVPVSEGTFYIYMRPSSASIHPATEFWLEAELNLHWDSSDTTLTARFEDPIPGSYQRIVVDCPHDGDLTSINIEGKGWYNSGEANSFNVADWYITTGVPV